MNLGVLTARPDLAIYAELEAAARRAGTDLVAFDAGRLTARAWPPGLFLAGRSVAVDEIGAVLPRVGNWRPDSTLAILETLEALGVPTLNTATAIRRGRDHWATIASLAAVGLPHPETMAASEPEELAAAVAAVIGFPCVVKQRRSRQGVGVVRCDALDVLQGVLDSLWRVGDEVVVQRFCRPAGVSRRVLVLAGEVLGATEHTAPEGEFRANAARGAGVVPVRLDPADADLAVAAARAVGLGFAGVDLLPDGPGWLVGEVNPTPGWAHFAAATGAPVADRVVGELCRRAR